MKDKIKAVFESVHMSEECTNAIAHALAVHDRFFESKERKDDAESHSS